MKDVKFKINCVMIKEDIDIIFKAIDFYRDCSILFTKDRKIARKCNKVWIFLNEHCITKDIF